MNPLEAALERAGLDFRVEHREGLALLVPRGTAEITSETRRTVIALAAEHGFTHVALELVD